MTKSPSPSPVDLSATDITSIRKGGSARLSSDVNFSGLSKSQNSKEGIRRLLNRFQPSSLPREIRAMLVRWLNDNCSVSWRPIAVHHEVETLSSRPKVVLSK